MFNHPDDSKKIADLIGYTFNDHKLLAQALTRKSAIAAKLRDKSIGHLETLEWYGDSVLNLAVTSLLKNFHPDKSEGELSQLRVKLIKNAGPLPRVARYLGLANFIIRAPSEKLTDKKLADHMEALLGAIFIDSKENYQIIKQFIEKHWKLLGLNEENLSVSDFGNESLLEAPDVSGKREQQLNQALLKAVNTRMKEKIELLLSAGAYIEATDKNGNTPLLLAHHTSQLELVKYLYEEWRANIDASDINHNAVIHFAAYNNRPDTLDFLLENFANVNLQNKDGNSPAHLAAEKGYLEIIKKLHQAEANFSLVNKQKKTIRQIAQEKQHIKIVNYIDQIQAAQNKLNQELLTFVDSLDRTAIHYRKEEIFAKVIAGADPFAKNQNGKNIFQIIVKKYTAFSLNPELIYGILKPILPRVGMELIGFNFVDIHNIEEDDFSLANLTNASFQNSMLYKVNFCGALLNRTNFDRCKFVEVDFTNADLTKANFSNTIMDGATFKTFISAFAKCRKSVKFNISINYHGLFYDNEGFINDKVNLHDVSLEKLDIEKLKFKFTAFNEKTFASILPQLKQGKIIKGTIDLRGVNLSALDLTNVTFKNFTFDRITFESLLPQLRNKNCKMTGAFLAGSEEELISFSTGSKAIKAILDGLDLNNLDLSELDIKNASLINTNLTNTNLFKSNLTGCNFNQAIITNANFQEAILDEGSLRSIIEKNRNFRIVLQGITITNARYINLSNLDLTNVKFKIEHGKDIEFVNFENSILTNASFGGAVLKQVNFSKVDLSNVDFSGVTFKEVNFEGAKLEGTKPSAEGLVYLLNYAKVKNISLKKLNLSKLNLNVHLVSSGFTFDFSTLDFTGVDIEEVNLQETKLGKRAFLSLLPLVKQSRISLQGIILENIELDDLDLSGVDLSGIKMVDSNLANANLKMTLWKNSKLKNVKFTNADLTHADFTGSYFYIVNTRNANMEAAIFTGVHMDRITLDGILKHVRHGVISLGQIYLENTGMQFSAGFNPISLKNCTLTGIKLNGVQFQTAAEVDKKFLISILPQVKEGQLSLQGLYLDFSLQHIDFSHVNFKGVYLNTFSFKSLLSSAVINNISFQGARFYPDTDLTKIDLSKIDLTGADFTRVKLNRNNILALLPYIQKKLITLSGADLRNCDLSNLDLCEIDLKNARLEQAEFIRTKLINSNLEEVMITDANFTDADLSRANLSKTRINPSSNTNFKNAILTHANLAEAHWFDAIGLIASQLSFTKNLEQARLDEKLKEEALKLQHERQGRDFNNNANDNVSQYPLAGSLFSATDSIKQRQKKSPVKSDKIVNIEYSNDNSMP